MNPPRSSILRSARMARKYAKDIANGHTHKLWDISPLIEYKYFKIIHNEYPHDRIAATHHILIPKRKIDSWKKLRWYENRELKKIDGELSRKYDAITRNYPSVITVPEIVHWHLYRFKK